jgi:hypothetical protein
MNDPEKADIIANSNEKSADETGELKDSGQRASPGHVLIQENCKIFLNNHHR